MRIKKHCETRDCLARHILADKSETICMLYTDDGFVRCVLEYSERYKKHRRCQKCLDAEKKHRGCV